MVNALAEASIYLAAMMEYLDIEILYAPMYRIYKLNFTYPGW